ncbi:MAG: serine protease [Prevotella sp.]|nr:serine protease [Prevotella sp.]
MRRFVLSLLFLMSLSSFGQRTDAPYVASQNNKIKVKYVDITDKATIVSIVFNGKGDGFWTPVHTVSISSNATLVTSDGYNEYTFPIRELSDGTKQLAFDQYYSVPGRKNTYCLKLIFDKIPAGCTSLDLNENVSGGWIWRGAKITNPACSTPHKYLSESEIKNMIIDSNDGICGIYEGVDEQGYKLACVKEDDEYLLLFMGVKNNDGRWYKGDVKAELRSSASAGLFKATWYMADKSKNEDAYLVFDGTTMKTYVSGEETNYLKMYPSASSQSGIASSGSSWSGTGFALKNGYIATNYHVVENANNISVYGVKGNSTIKYSASVIATDKVNDLALIQIKDNQFNGFGEIPYRVKTTTSNVGENVFVLGYPLITTMGNEIKLTTGVISSKTGFMGDVSLYQISAPIQPGNSGGPLFDNQGNLIGIVNAKHRGTENVGYAIKASYLNNLIESVTNSSILPNNNLVSAMNLTNKVKSLEKFVFMIVCSN